MPCTDQHLAAAITRLLNERAADSTICPSEVARALSSDAWRPLMPRVREVAVGMARQGALDIRQKGRTVDPDGTLRGPIRLGHKTSETADTAGHPTTPDGRYFVVRGRLWRKTNPHLPKDVRDDLVAQLMDARRALRGQLTDAQRKAARARVDRVKRALGERGPVWWDDGAPDYNRKLAKNTPYREWFSRTAEQA
ncbi:DUF3253 domain-containing protein [Bordetella genomosp. 13]|uniref:DUF3253 domain-containing protein n=1 Tax=Bordetella genomosp. 13 TaxID=463040 RepID=UPI001642EF84|nr:DUF3253 domain-containing protein [Bordetella genomosp. 13]